MGVLSAQEQHEKLTKTSRLYLKFFKLAETDAFKTHWKSTGINLNVCSANLGRYFSQLYFIFVVSIA